MEAKVEEWGEKKAKKIALKVWLEEERVCNFAARFTGHKKLELILRYLKRYCRYKKVH